MLLQNYNVFNANPGHAIGGPTDPTLFFKGGTFPQFYYGDSRVSGQTEKASWYISSAPHYTFVFAPKSGGLSSRNNTNVTITPTGALAGGLPVSGSTTITFDVTGTGGLIVSGSGTATITFTPTGTIISVAAASGSSTITFSPTATIGAEANLSGSSTVTITPTMTSYAIGYLSGTASNETEFSPENLARAVWEALAASYNTAGTMGEKMNSAASAGDPWGTALPGAYASGTAGNIVGAKLLTTGKFLALK